jgi:hypothetical protein
MTSRASGNAGRTTSDVERLDPMNGLLLVAHADSLFDRYLMSFQEVRGAFVSVLHPRIHSAVEKLGLRHGIALDTSHLGLADEGRFGRYMAGHLERHRELLHKDRPAR